MYVHLCTRICIAAFIVVCVSAVLHVIILATAIKAKIGEIKLSCRCGTEIISPNEIRTINTYIYADTRADNFNDVLHAAQSRE